MRRRKPYVTVELRKERLDSPWIRIEHTYSDVNDQIWEADYLASVCAEDMKDGKIVDWQIEY